MKASGGVRVKAEDMQILPIRPRLQTWSFVSFWALDGRGEEVLDIWVEGSYGHNLSNVGGFKAEGIQAELVVEKDSKTPGSSAEKSEVPSEDPEHAGEESMKVCWMRPVGC